ncbi:MAG: hypothetical protein HQL27_09705 [Candidatus Omnitrophica bacterium]|nr:hypothetical protein [Candidatus Omnitrophota bacterium]
MKKTLLVIALLTIFAAQSLAFISELKILTKEEIAKLTPEEITKVYIDAKVEVNASKVFYSNSGFSSTKEFGKYKELLTFVIDLRREMEKRSIPIPPIEEWLK